MASLLALHPFLLPFPSVSIHIIIPPCYFVVPQNTLKQHESHILVMPTYATNSASRPMETKHAVLPPSLKKKKHQPRSCSHLLCVYVYVFPCLCSSATALYSWQQLTINNIIFKYKCASCMRCASLNRDAGLHYCMLLYFITSVIMVVLGGTNIFCGGMRHKKFENHCYRE